ncbi:conserved hypothetical protein [Histoplasma capsulatum G186AR]|uniref:Subtilisin-like protease n=2 Tax=Ajellomyces capsulatus TaxID=5037 RepID=C0NSQ1_AJECG|nr:uncharacterized protein HCBG_06181 [Histoplasma capsulatum G186AR]EEH05917.1 conserved hypothetical protein [Histoplasma capsulatum G186AR]KAG5299916.1 proteinase T precursor [Histoplasma capsulatum]QSS67455.1 proteinase T precursor [Histoplasma capsulatum G186AR]
MHLFDTFLPLALVALSTTTDAAPFLEAGTDGQLIPNQYIIVMKPNTTDEKFETHQSWVSSKLVAADSGVSNGGVSDHFKFDDQFRAYAGVFGDDTIKQISDDEDVAYIEQNKVVQMHQFVVEKNAPSWGLGRISATEPGVKDYIYDSSAGEGITAYIIDSGIDAKHPEFGGRATWGTNTLDSQDEDCRGHGTHVAGTIGSTTYGVSKRIKLIGVKVLDCKGTGSAAAILKGVKWAVNHAQEHGDPKKSVMNLSLGMGFSRAFNEALAAVVRAGIFVSVSAGNAHRDASNESPASESTVCTVGATDDKDKMAGFSNFGSGIDLFAPGVDIISTIPGGKTDSYSGTSMSSPHVAGVAAYLMSLENISGGSVCDRMKSIAQDSAEGTPKGTTTKLLYNGGKSIKKDPKPNDPKPKDPKPKDPKPKDPKPKDPKPKKPKTKNPKLCHSRRSRRMLAY